MNDYSYVSLREKIEELGGDKILNVLKERGLEKAYFYVIKRVVGKSIIEDFSVDTYDAIDAYKKEGVDGMRIVIDRKENDGSKTRLFMNFLFTGNNNVLDETEGVF